jgi:hypothetical protein
MTTTNAAGGQLRTRQLRAEMGWRIAVSIVSVFGLAIFLLLYFTFWAAGCTWIQSAAVVVVSIMVFIAANGAAWASWGTRFVSPLTGGGE